MALRNPNFPSHNLISSVCVLSHSVVTDSVTHWTVAHQALLSMEFFRQEYLLQEIFLTQGLNPCLLYLLHWTAGSLSLCYLGIPELMKVLSKRAFQIHDVTTLFHGFFTI